MLKYDSLAEGDQVCWTGSEDEGDTIYTVLKIYENAGRDTVIVIGDGYTGLEVFLSELY